MKASVGRAACIGCGLCVQICPEVFSLDDEAGVAVVVGGEADEAKAKEAAASCPVGCIIIN